MANVSDDPNYVSVWFCFMHEQKGPKFKCGHIHVKDLPDYQDKVDYCYPSAQDRCMQYHCHSVLHSHPRLIKGDVQVFKTLSIVNKNPIYMRCFCGELCPKNCERKVSGACPGASFDCVTRAKQCFENISAGKCQDPFIIECIGKKFFPVKYLKTNIKGK